MKSRLIRRLKLSRWLLPLSAIELVLLILYINKTPSGVSALELLCITPLVIAGIVIFWLAYFSQFIVPLDRTGDRFKILLRVLLFPTILHGQNLLIEGGVVKQTEEELNNKGLGTAVLDVASAAVLETPVRQSRAIGPGVSFLGFTETLGAALHIRPRKHFLGPQDREKPEDPFANQLSGESDKEYKERQDRRAQTRAYTRDGNEVVPNIFIKFRLNAQPGTGKTPYGFDPNSVMQAFTSREINSNLPEDSNKRLADWDYITSKVAMDVWRELVASFKLKELFTSIEPGNKTGKTGITLINEVLRQRMTQASAPVILFNPNGSGISLGAPVRSKEFDLLRRRGIKVDVCLVLNLRFESSIENTLVQDWATSWLQRARADREQQVQDRSLGMDNGRLQARVNFVTAVSQQVAANSSGDDASLLLECLNGCNALYQTYPALLQIAGDERQAIIEMQEFINNDK